jgi:hypothetical protein
MTPKEAIEAIMNNNDQDAYYKQYDTAPGWGLYVIDEIEKLRNESFNDDI